MARAPRFALSLVLSALAVVAVASCSDEETPTGPASSGVTPGGGGSGGSSAGGSGGAAPVDGPEAILGGDCDSLVPDKCGFPFPSDVYTVKDATKSTGRHLHFTKKMMPVYDLDGKTRESTEQYEDHDGFSPGVAAMAYLPGATNVGLASATHMADSILKTSPTLLIEADTGALVPHIAELDDSAYHQDRKAIMIRPAIRLKDATRYLVAIRHVKDADGNDLAPSPTFQTLREGWPSDDPSVVNRRDRYADIFAKLASAGIDKSDLQLAWDYTTASRDNNVGDVIAMRDDALARVGTDGPTYVIGKTEPTPNEHIHSRLTVTTQMPCYLEDCTSDPHHSRILRDEAGKPKYNGTMAVDVLVHLPNSLQGKSGPPVQNGHGLLGSKEEGQDGYLAQFADERGYVAFGVDLFGFDQDDQGPVLDVLGGDISTFRDVVERQDQGLVNSLVAMRFMRGKFASDPAVTFSGVSAIDATQGFYRGDSQGGIMGTTYMAITTDVTRGLLGEPGMPYNLLLNRSVDFAPFFGFLRATYDDDLDIQLGLGFIQILWDRSEPDGFAPYITDNNLPNTPSHHVLIHAGVGDYQVTPLGAENIARTIGAKSLAPAPRDIFAVPPASAPLADTNVIVEYDFGLPPVPDTDIPPTGPGFPDDGDPHDKIRSLAPSTQQSDIFFRTGVVQQACDGVCDPT